ncbi:HD-GYP domain-containing protein [Amphibacillus cookii]|uniref:HD-GYP domain-containing protein n=1 Tax=Amphibacillus cookii TaxID=767787 RepID=UPI00195F1B76|nr:HD-GYP domain-containing protein [Amphibacillus cookii]MBM7541448.1 putative nucleotidyltransferase with HDIG domain [Amphibacillus cookii]
MKLVATRALTVGAELAKPIYSSKGQILVQKDVVLTETFIKRLLDLGVTYVYIRDELSDDIVVHSPISEQLRIKSINSIKSAFLTYKTKTFKKEAVLLEHTNEEIASVVDMMITEIDQDDQVVSLMSDIFVSDNYLFNHSINVTIYAIVLAKALKRSNKEIRELGLGAMLHDIGKVFLPHELLKKKGKLTDKEFEVIKTHSELGFEFLRSFSTLPLMVSHCAYQHHERLDGSGYPRGIKGSEIHLYGKILAIVDVFDAVTSDRVYRDAMLPQEGLEILYAGSGTLFDPHMVKLFRESVAVYPNGVTVELSDKRTGLVVKQNKKLYNRPVVRVISENDQQINPYELDLAKHLDVTITAYKV